MRLLHFSDLHVQLPTWRRSTPRSLGWLRFIATGELWKGRGRLYDEAQTKVAAFAALARQHDHAVLTGDLTQLGHRREFELTRAALGALADAPERLTIIAGNHDRYPVAGKAQRDFEELFPAHDLEALAQPKGALRFGPVVVRRPLPGLALILVDSVGELSWPVVSRGIVSPEALAGVRAAVAAPELAADCKLVVTHYPPVGEHGRPRLSHPLRNPCALLGAARGAQALLCGHIHERYDVQPAGGPRVLCVGSSTEAGREGAFSLLIERGQLVRVDPCPLPSPLSSAPQAGASP